MLILIKKYWVKQRDVKVLTRASAAELRSYHITGGIPVEKELAIHS
jgi:hypothetical protein